MGRADFFKLGDHNVICDKCGFKYKSSAMRKQWDNLYVCHECFDVRHPQDFVRSIKDNQTVPIARVDVAASTGTTTVGTAGTKGATSIVLTSVTGLAKWDSIGIVLDNGDCFWSSLSADPSGTTITFTAGSYLPYTAAAGNTVYMPSVNNETYITATEITATEL